MMNVRPPREPLEFAKHRQNVLTTEEPPVEIVPQALEFAAFTRKYRFLARGVSLDFTFLIIFPFLSQNWALGLSLKSNVILKSSHKSEIKSFSLKSSLV